MMFMCAAYLRHGLGHCGWNPAFDSLTCSFLGLFDQHVQKGIFVERPPYMGVRSIYHASSKGGFIIASLSVIPDVWLQ